MTAVTSNAETVDSNASDTKSVVHDAARRARKASRVLALLTTAQKDAALNAAADAVLAASDRILAANALDIDTAKAGGTEESLLDRLRLTAERIEGIASGLRQVAGLPDPIGEVLRGSTLPNGLELRQQRVPLGVVGMVYEARPNVTVDAFGLTLKSGNAALLRGSSSAVKSNEALVAALRASLIDQGLPEDSVQLLPSADRSTVTHLIQARGLVDVVIPRGGAGLISAVVRDATVPTIETGVGNCHVYVHSAADLLMAEKILLNSKTRRPSVCNTAETVLVDAAIADLKAACDAGKVAELPGFGAKTQTKILEAISLRETFAARHTMPARQVMLLDDGAASHDAFAMLPSWNDEVIALKAFTYFPENTPPHQTLYSQILLFNRKSGEPIALVDGVSVTCWRNCATKPM